MKENNFVSHFRNEAAYIARYSGSGVVNTVLGFFVIFTAMAFGVPPVISNIAGYAVGFISGFVLSKKFVFRSSGHFVGESIRYLVAFIVSFLFYLFMLHVALTYLELHAVIAQIVAAVSYTSLMYILTRVYVFDNAKMRC